MIFSRAREETGVAPLVSRYSRRGDISFYSATLCVSAVLAVSRCPSVCLSVTLVYCIQTAKDIVKLVLGLVAYSCSFLTPFDVTQFQRKPTQLGR